jgi:hypothetical protein
VIRVVLQFLKENSLLNTFEALTNETNVHLNTVEKPDQLVSAIKGGEWDIVLRELATVELSGTNSTLGGRFFLPFYFSSDKKNTKRCVPNEFV